MRSSGMLATGKHWIRRSAALCNTPLRDHHTRPCGPSGRPVPTGHPLLEERALECELEERALGAEEIGEYGEEEAIYVL